MPRSIVGPARWAAWVLGLTMALTFFGMATGCPARADFPLDAVDLPVSPQASELISLIQGAKTFSDITDQVVAVWRAFPYEPFAHLQAINTAALAVIQKWDSLDLVVPVLGELQIAAGETSGPAQNDPMHLLDVAWLTAWQYSYADAGKEFYADKVRRLLQQLQENLPEPDNGRYLFLVPVALIQATVPETGDWESSWKQATDLPGLYDWQLTLLWQIHGYLAGPPPGGDSETGSEAQESGPDGP